MSQQLPHDQTIVEHGPRCVTGSLLRARCDVCFRSRADVVQVLIMHVGIGRQSMWLCGECADKIAYDDVQGERR